VVVVVVIIVVVTAAAAVLLTGKWNQWNWVYTRCSLCRLIRLLSTWCRAAAFFSAIGAALSEEDPTVK
jgi:hypothetical protein